eukprot:3306343-Pleurochrysis_carterae.AAC.1
MPGVGTNFGKPPLPFTIVAGQRVSCSLPFVSASKGAQIAPMPDDDMSGMLIGVLVGEEQWTSSRSNKKKSEFGRFALVKLDE